jgi:Protein of unknown function (DUF3800)
MSKKLYFFIDESGDPHFYAKGKRPLWTEPTFEPILMLGMIVVENRKALRQDILDFQNQILADPLYNTIASVMKPNWFLHASKDHAEVRIKFIEFLRAQKGIKFYVIIGRKIHDIFHNKHNSKASEFYFDLLNKLLSRYEFEDKNKNLLFLSERQSNTMDRFVKAVEKAQTSESKMFSPKHFICDIVQSKDHPEMSVVDYYLWTLKRYITTGERRYFSALESNCVEVFDIYENAGKGKIFSAQDPFYLEKVSLYRHK